MYCFGRYSLYLMLIQTSPTLLSLSSQLAIKFTHRGYCGHGDMLDKRSFNCGALISVDGVWGGDANLGHCICKCTAGIVAVPKHISQGVWVSPNISSNMSSEQER